MQVRVDGRIRTGWATALAVGTVALLLAGCVVNARRGSGAVVTRVVEVPAFRGVDVTSGFSVTLRKGPAAKVTLEVDDNLADDVDVTVTDGTLRVGLRPGVVAARATLRADVTVPSEGEALDAVRLSGAARLEADDPLQSRALAVDVDGASTLVAELDVGALALDCSGASRVRLDGDADDAAVQVSGATAVDASELLVGTLVADVSGGSSLQAYALRSADLEASGASRIRWSGEATLARADSTGASSITKVTSGR